MIRLYILFYTLYNYRRRWPSGWWPPPLPPAASPQQRLGSWLTPPPTPPPFFAVSSMVPFAESARAHVSLFFFFFCYLAAPSAADIYKTHSLTWKSASGIIIYLCSTKKEKGTYILGTVCRKNRRKKSVRSSVFLFFFSFGPDVFTLFFFRATGQVIELTWI